MLTIKDLPYNKAARFFLFKCKPFFSGSFFFSLAIAILLHLLGGSLFRIRSSTSGKSLHLLPTVIVEAYDAELFGEPSFESNLYQETTKFLLRSPVLPQAALEVVQYAPPSDPFLTQTVLSTIPPQLSREPILTPQVQITATGSLATVPFVFTGQERYADYTNSRQMRAVYDVRMDTRSGKIFWYRPLYSEGASYENIENLLELIVFEKREARDIARGTIELILTRENQ